jgi:hypothetical protein
MSMEILIIVLIALITIFIIIFAVVSSLKKSERQKYYAAAENILREDYLNYSLKNTMYSDEQYQEPSSKKTMVYLKSKSSGKKAQFVFDPEKKITVGRDKNKNNIYINDMYVSQNHCSIFSMDDKVYLQDLNSINGTIVKRGIFKKYEIFNGCFIELRSNDRIIIGNNCIKIILFYFDMSY